MSSILLVRSILIFVFIVILVLIFKINKMILLERRIARYSLKRLTLDDVSISDRILFRYKKLINKFYKNRFLKRLSINYDKYLYGTDGSNAIIFIVNKLIIGMCFMLLLIKEAS